MKIGPKKWDTATGEAYPTQTTELAISQGQFCQLCEAWRGSLGREPTVEMYVEHTIEVLRAIRRVLRSDGVCFWNIGSSYAGSGTPGGDFRDGKGGDDYLRPYNRQGNNLKPLDDALIPQRVALAAQADGWWCRSMIVLAKKNPMPESVGSWRWERCRVKVKAQPKAQRQSYALNLETAYNRDQSGGIDKAERAQYQDCPGCARCSPHGGYVLRKGSWRPTESHEYLLMLTKSGTYYSSGEDVREVSTERASGNIQRKIDTDGRLNTHLGFSIPYEPTGTGRNLRSVWEITTEPFGLELCRACKRIYEPRLWAQLPRDGQAVLCRCGLPSSELIVNGGVTSGAESYQILDSVCSICHKPFLNRDYVMYQQIFRSPTPNAATFIPLYDTPLQGIPISPSANSSSPSAEFFRECLAMEQRLPISVTLEAAEGMLSLFSMVSLSQNGPPAPSAMDNDTLTVADCKTLSGAIFGRLALVGPPVLCIDCVTTGGALEFSGEIHSNILSHFATFAKALPAKCILIGTAPKVCGKCGAPWARILEHHRPADYNPNEVDERQHGNALSLAKGSFKPSTNRPLSKIFDTSIKSTIETLGWLPTCACGPDAGTKPSIVLDCFCGSGTTLVAARELSRNAIGIDISEDYLALARHRLERTNPGLG